MQVVMREMSIEMEKRQESKHRPQEMKNEFSRDDVYDSGGSRPLQLRPGGGNKRKAPRAPDGQIKV